MGALKPIWELLRDTYLAWLKDGAQALAAALAYYALFSLAPLLIIVVAIASLIFGPASAERALAGQLQYLVGEDAAVAIQQLISSAARPGAGVVASALGLGTLLLGASAAFGQLQHALNHIWRKQARRRRGIYNTLRMRAFSLGMILIACFLLLLSLLFNAAIAALNYLASDAVAVINSAWQWINLAFSVVVSAALFGFTFRVLPNVKLRFRDLWPGACLTSLLFNLGKFLIAFYLGRSSIASGYGAAGSLVVILVWVYYSAQILYFGAEFTKVYACRYGSLAPAEPANLVDGPAMSVEDMDEPQ